MPAPAVTPKAKQRIMPARNKVALLVFSAKEYRETATSASQKVGGRSRRLSVSPQQLTGQEVVGVEGVWSKWSFLRSAVLALSKLRRFLRDLTGGRSIVFSA